MTRVNKRRFTLALNALLRARSLLVRTERNPPGVMTTGQRRRLTKLYDARRKHLYGVIEVIIMDEF